MNHIHGTRRLSITLAGLAATALALPACQATATAMPHHHHATHVTVQPTENGLTVRDLKDLANVKRNLQAAAQQIASVHRQASWGVACASGEAGRGPAGAGGCSAGQMPDSTTQMWTRAKAAVVKAPGDWLRTRP